MFWNAEGIALRRRGVPAREFRVEDYGAPPYPEVLLVTSSQTLRREPAEQRADFDARIGIVKQRPDLSRAFAFGFLN